jgi:hypothetical protein
VLKTWKLVEARKAAMEKAKSLAAEARDAHKSFRALLAGRPNVHVLLPPTFSWMPASGGEDQVSETGVNKVEGLKLPGNEFMRAVFGLEPGGTAAAFNAPHTIAYAIYLEDLAPSYNVRWDEFQFAPFSSYEAVAGEDQRATYRAWIDEIKRSVDFKESAERRQAARPSADSGEPIDFDF